MQGNAISKSGHVDIIGKDTSGSQDTIIASFVGPGGPNTKNNANSGSVRGSGVRAATLEKGAGN